MEIAAVILMLAIVRPEAAALTVPRLTRTLSAWYAGRIGPLPLPDTQAPELTPARAG